jgi:hypothetical protein
VPRKTFESNNIGFFGAQARIASNVGGPIKHKPQLLIAETFAGGITGKIYQHHLFNTMTHEALIGTDRKDFGFIDDIEKAAQAAPQLDELKDFENLNSWPHARLTQQSRAFINLARWRCMKSIRQRVSKLF